MSVAELIAELQKMSAHAPVRMRQDDIDDTEGLAIVEVTTDIDVVLWEGNHVLLSQS